MSILHRSASDVPRLTKRETEILHRVASGSTNRELAEELWVTRYTVKFHLRNIYRKLGVRNRHEATSWYSSRIESVAEA